jgi:hypothetical protein
MKRLRAWIERLGSESFGSLVEHRFRVIVQGIDSQRRTGTLIGLEPLGRLPSRPGDTTPKSALLLRFLDTPRPGLESGLIANELGALLTLVSGCRIEVAMELALSAPPSPGIYFMGIGGDPTVNGPIPDSSFAVLSDYLSRLSSLDSDDLAALAAAADLHYGAVILAEQDQRAAYVLLVAGLEVLSRRFGAPPASWCDWDLADTWEVLFDRASLSPSQAQAIRDHLMRDRQLRLAATFREYASRSLPEGFWDYPLTTHSYGVHLPQGTRDELLTDTREIETLVPRDRETLAQALNKTYALRSGIMHRGQEIALFEIGVKSGVPIAADQPLPYAVLRSILATLIRYELERLGQPTPLPDIQTA